MIKDIIKGLLSFIILLITIPYSFWLCKGWRESTKELNKHRSIDGQYSTNYWSVYIREMKDLLWNDSLFD